MRLKPVRSGLFVTAAAVSIAFAAFPGVSGARTDNDFRCSATGPGVSRSATGVCTELTTIGAYKTAELGGPRDVLPIPGAPNLARLLPPDEPRQCLISGPRESPDGKYIIGGTQEHSDSYAYLWSWDYYVEGGDWVLWNGGLPGEWPNGGVPWPGSEGFGVNSLRASLDNWNVYYPVEARVFWICYPAPGSGIPAAMSGSARAGTTLPPPTLGQQRGGDKGEDRLRGDKLDNALVGRAGDDRLSGGDGKDHLHAGAGDDALSGGDDGDLLHARSGDDMASGGGGVDDILTGKGDDVSSGGAGGDQLFDDQGGDHLRGGPGNDLFSAHDGDRDRIDCGPGEDIALIDGKDVTTGCEHAYRNKREAPRKLPKI